MFRGILSSRLSLATTLTVPQVRVPVLSKAITSELPRTSRASGDLKIIPSFAALPVPAIMATGVASPKAHGQDTTSTHIAKDKDSENSADKTKYHTIKVRAETAKIAGTKYEAATSAILAIGTLV